MTQHSRNLTPERGPDVWTRTAQAQHASEQAFRWVVGASGAVLMAAGLSSRMRARHALTVGGAALVGLALSTRRSHAALEYASRAHARRRTHDCVTDASALSFPASDSPSWTPTTGSGATERGR